MKWRGKKVMSKEEKSTKYEGALYYLMTETVAYNDNKLIPLAKQALDDLQELVKRNEPVRLLAYDNNCGMVEAKSTEDYNYDEWYCAMGYCPICGEQNPIDFNFCGKCGNKLDNDWEDK